MAHRPAITPRILKTGIDEREPLTNWLRHRRRIRTRHDGRLHLEEREQVPQVQRLRIHIARRQQQLLDQVPAPHE
jgi:hypothetical protein